MKRFLPILLLPLLAACRSSISMSENVEQQLINPLYAERYYDELTDHMVTLEIQNDPLTEDDAMQDIITNTRVESLARAKEANAKQRQGLGGFFVSDYEYAYGEALLLENTLYFGPDFTVLPSPDLRVYLTNAVDPRAEEAFPDATAVELGSLKNPYGAQSYDNLPSPASAEAAFRTVVLWDSVFNRIYGFAQLRGQ